MVAQKELSKFCKEMALMTEGGVCMDLKVSDVAKALGVCSKTVYRLIADGKLTALHLSPTCIRIDATDFEAYRDSMKARKPYTRKKAAQ